MAAWHLQLPDNRDRDEQDQKVNDDGADSVSEEELGRVDASALRGVWVDILFPEIGQWATCDEDGDDHGEEVADDERHHDVHGDFEVEEAVVEDHDGGFGACYGGGVDADVGEEEFPNDREIVLGEGLHMAAISVIET